MCGVKMFCSSRANHTVENSTNLLYLPIPSSDETWNIFIGVRAGGARRAAAPPNFGQLKFFGQREKIWAKPGLKTSSCLFNYFKDLNINLKLA